MLRAAICGVGHWGLRLIQSVQGKSLKLSFTTAVTRDPASKHDLAPRYGLRLTAHYEEVIADPAIDAVVLATPHSQHAEQIVSAARAGKHVFVEKPFTLTRADAERAISACRSAGVTLQVGFNRRYAPAYREMERRIAAGEIGKLRHLEGHFSGPPSYQTDARSWRSNRIESPGGGMTARGIHVLDSMLHLAGAVERVFAFSERLQLAIDVDDTTVCALRFASGATGLIATLHAASNFYRIHAFGSAGALEMRGDAELFLSDLDGRSQRFEYAPIDKERAELEAFADAIARRVPFVISPDEIINGVAVTEAVAQSAGTGLPIVLT